LPELGAVFSLRVKSGQRHGRAAVGKFKVRFNEQGIACPRDFVSFLADFLLKLMQAKLAAFDRRGSLRRRLSDEYEKKKEEK